MKTRAAVAFEAKQPLEIVELDLTKLPAGEYTVDVNGIPGLIVMGTDNP